MATEPMPQDEIKERIREWQAAPYDEKTRAEVRRLLKEDPAELNDAFACDVAFGTGGMRCIMGVGTNRMNLYTIGRATQGLANALKHLKVASPSVLIGYDSRHNSAEFAQHTATVLAANGIRVYLTSALRPTPLISFGVRHLKASAGVMITASHNPKEYNGYKVYWADGGQVVPPHDTLIMKEVHSCTIEEVKTKAKKELITLVGDELDHAYLKEIARLQQDRPLAEKSGKTLKIAYTSLHGVGATLTPKALTEWGFPDIHPVSEQIKPDGDFPTVAFPNPEFKETLDLGIRLMLSDKCDILLATDPDADRLGVVALHDGEPLILTGNEVAALLASWLCANFQVKEKLHPRHALVTTIVSSDLIDRIAEEHHIQCVKVLTGFKYIGEKIHLWEQGKEGLEFLFGAEESCGYLFGTLSRDKDGVLSSCLIAEMALALKVQGKTLIDELFTLFFRHGIFREGQKSITFKSEEEKERLLKRLDALRKKPPQKLAHTPVVLVEDYGRGVATALPSGLEAPLTLPKSDVLLLRLEDESKVVIRPSGTEPKLKIYVGTSTRIADSPEAGMMKCDKRNEELIAATLAALA